MQTMRRKRLTLRNKNSCNNLYTKIFLKNASVLRFYQNLQIPKDYICSNCKIKGIRLWRMSYSSEINLLCLKCAEKNQNSYCKYSYCSPKIIWQHQEMWNKYAEDNSMKLDTEEKRNLSKAYRHAISDQIGWYVPAVPDETLTTYYGYTSVPQPGVDWWERLPLRLQV